MCGIAGYISKHGRAERSVVLDQLRPMGHRGPDARGVFAAGRAAIGQNRLSVIDVAGGDPPITSDDGHIGVALNGEIYNFQDIGAQLRAQGHRFSTRCDTEVIAHLAEFSPPSDVARRLDGMFAYAYWDNREEWLVLGRDRLGKKPLYYWSGEGEFVFGSEIKAVLEHPRVPVRLDAGAIPAYLSLGYVPTPRTFYEGVHSVPPGHVLVVDRGLAVRLEPYWEPRVPGVEGTGRVSMGMDEASRETRRLLATAVERRLVSDVPLGAFLSGGIDSSAVVGLMASALPIPVKTFTIGFEDDDQWFDERPHARAVADRFDTDHTEFVVRPAAVDLVERLVWHHDQPFGDSSAIPTFLLSELTSDVVTVALSGDGGDELFAGYERFAASMLADRFSAVPAPAQRALHRGLGALGRRTPLPTGKAERFLREAGVGLPGALRAWVSYVPDDIVEQLVEDPSPWHVADYERIWEDSRGAHPLDRVLLLNLRTYLLDDLLPKVDRMSMAHGLEVRSPFLDRELVEFSLRLPPQTKLRGVSLKRVLKRAVADLIPQAILDRPKKGFGVPLGRWFREDLSDYALGVLGGDDARLRSHVRFTAVETMLDDHLAGRRDHGHALWTLLTLEVFLRSRDW